MPAEIVDVPPETQPIHEAEVALLLQQSGAEPAAEATLDAADVLPPEPPLFSTPEDLKTGPLNKVVIGYIVAMHLGCLAAPFFISVPGLIGCAILHWATCSIGICLGFHRYLSHRAFKLRTPAEFFVLLCGAISGEGSPLMWTAVHRLHHQKSDQPGDPHSPNDGKWWSHFLWLFPNITSQQQAVLFDRYVPELKDRPMMRFFEATYAWWLLMSGLVMLGMGYAFGGWTGAISMLLWAGCVRITLSYHSTWFVNSATHLWGYRNYETRDMSRNLWWVALVSYGEGWHNNHHAHPSVAPAGHRWWEVDTTYWVIRLLKMFGLATDVRQMSQATETGSQ